MRHINSRLFLRCWYVMLCLLLAGCDFGDTKGNNADKILASPRYKMLTDSISRFPNDPRPYAERGLFLSQNNYHELATPDYKKAWELNPEEPMALEYVNNLMLVDKPREAIAFLKECIANWPQSTDLHRRLSEIYEQINQPARALAQYDDLLQQDSLNFEAWYNKGILLGRLKDTAGAIDALERSYAAQPIYYNGITLAGFYATTENPKTPALCDELIAKDQTGATPDAHFVKGLYYSYTHKYDTALALFNECIARDWRFADAHVEKGIIFFDRKNYEEALKIFKTAVTVANTNADAFFWIARTYEETGQKDLAVQNYKRVLVLDPSYREAMEGIRRLRK